jgi:succinate---hydroxymethylglutarate CoA-transferase
MVIDTELFFFSSNYSILTVFIVQARDMVKTVSHPALGDIKLVNTPVKYSETQPRIRAPPPLLGQHSDEVLKGLGMEDKEISQLRDDGIIS